MFVVELAFDGNPARLALRPAHRETLSALHAAGEVLVAGPLTDGSGAVVVLATTRERVDEILAEDPYYGAEGVTVSSIREITSVLEDPSG